MLATPRDTYAILFPAGSDHRLDLQGFSGPFTVSWLDPATGVRASGSRTRVTGPGLVSLGSPPGAGTSVAIVAPERNRRPRIEFVRADPKQVAPGAPLAIAVRVADPDGPGDVLRAGIRLFDPAGARRGDFRLQRVGGGHWMMRLGSVPRVASGAWTIVGWARDGSGALAIGQATLTVL